MLINVLKMESNYIPKHWRFFLQLVCLFPLSLCEKQYRKSHGRAQITPCSTPPTQSFHLLIPVLWRLEPGWSGEAGPF